jgi:octaprenyl-diphosphate synthase
MTKTINKIKEPIALELQQYDVVFKEIMSSNIKLVDTVVKYIVKHKGKSLRPLLVLLSAKLVGEPVKNTYRVAAIVEMLHSASLIHDDVVDEATVRRGFPSVNAVWKNKVAVLIGDYLLSKCLIGATLTERLEVMNILANSAKRLSKGELLQIEKSIRMNITEEEYLSMISDKTAALIGAAAELGALSASDNKEDSEKLRNFGENLGIAFQIHDDLLDYYGHQSIIGKPVGNDFKEKKITLPLIHSFQKAQPKEIKRIKKMLNKGVTRKEVSYIITFAEDYGGIDYSQLKKKEYAQKAKDYLQTYPDNKIRSALYSFVDYIIQRKL